MKIFNSKRKIPIFYCATSKTLLANIPDSHDYSNNLMSNATSPILVKIGLKTKKLDVS